MFFVKTLRSIFASNNTHTPQNKRPKDFQTLTRTQHTELTASHLSGMHKDVVICSLCASLVHFNSVCAHICVSSAIVLDNLMRQCRCHFQWYTTFRSVAIFNISQI